MQKPSRLYTHLSVFVGASANSHNAATNYRVQCYRNILAVVLSINLHDPCADQRLHFFGSCLTFVNLNRLAFQLAYEDKD